VGLLNRYEIARPFGLEHLSIVLILWIFEENGTLPQAADSRIPKKAGYSMSIQNDIFRSRFAKTAQYLTFLYFISLPLGLISIIKRFRGDELSGE